MYPVPASVLDPHLRLLVIGCCRWTGEYERQWSFSEIESCETEHRDVASEDYLHYYHFHLCTVWALQHFRSGAGLFMLNNSTSPLPIYKIMNN